MPTERSITLYLVATLLTSTTHFCVQTMPNNETTEDTWDKGLSEKRGLCLSRCGTPETEHAKTRSSNNSHSSPQPNAKDSNCYQKCLEEIKQPRKGIKRSTVNEVSSSWKYVCSSEQLTTIEQKLGDIQNLSVVFLRERDKDGNFTWIANVTWDVSLNKSLNILDKWKGSIITWSKPSDSSPVVTLTYCQFIFKNTTNYVIRSGTTSWVYPGKISVGVLISPPSIEDSSGVTLTTFDPKGSTTIQTSTKEKTQNESIKATKESRTTLQPRPKPKRLFLPISIGCFVGIMIVCAVVYLAWKRRNKDDTGGNPSTGQVNYEYDASILYSTKDEDWVTTELIPLLETQNNFKCFIHYRDYEIGRVIAENMSDAVNKGRKNLAVVSNNFLESNYCKDEMHMALERVQRLGDCSLIVLNLDGVPKERLPDALLVRTFVNLTNTHEHNNWKNRLVRQISVENQQKSFVRIQENSGVSVVLDGSTSSNESEI